MSSQAEQPLEAHDVDRIGRHVQAVGDAGPHDRVGAETLAQAGHVRLQRLVGRARRLLAPHQPHDARDRYRRSGRQGEHGEHRLALRRADIDRFTVVGRGGDATEQTNLHLDRAPFRFRSSTLPRTRACARAVAPHPTPGCVPVEPSLDHAQPKHNRRRHHASDPAAGTVGHVSHSTTNPTASPAAVRPASLARIGAWCYDHRKAAVGIWLAALVVVFGAAGAIGPAYDASTDIPDSESADGFDVLDQLLRRARRRRRVGNDRLPRRPGRRRPRRHRRHGGALRHRRTPGSPTRTATPQHPGATVVSPYSEQGESQIARQGPLAGQLAYAQVNLAADVDLTESAALGEAISDHAPAIEGLEVLPGGTALAVFEPPETEFIGLAFAIVVLILAFGSVLAMGLPIAVALGGVGAGMGLIVILSNVFNIPDFTTFLGIMIGLGVGIDYALFIVTRYREGLHAGRSPREATITAMDTAGRAVIFAGVTVVVSLLGLLLIGIGWVAGMGIGVAVTVLVTMITSITLLPALLGFARERVEVTRWRGLIVAAFVAVALLGIGIGVPALTAAGAGLAALTLLVSFAVRPLRRDGASPARRSRCARPSPTGGAARSSAARGSGSSPARRSCSSSRRRSSACASGSPTRATTPRTPTPARPTTCSPRASAPASTARS